MKARIRMFLYCLVMASGTAFLTGYIEGVENLEDLPTEYPQTHVQP